MGYTLAETLSTEGHAVAAIDNNDDAISRLSALDVSAVKATAAATAPWLDAGVKDCDILIAVTNRDEVNLLCCLIAKRPATAGPWPGAQSGILSGD